MLDIYTKEQTVSRQVKLTPQVFPRLENLNCKMILWNYHYKTNTSGVKVVQENISIPAFLATLSLDQLESVSIRAKEKANEIRMGERVTLWRVGTPHTNEYITENVERAIIYMRIQLDSFVKEKGSSFKYPISLFIKQRLTTT